MSEVSFKNIELPLEQKLLFIYLFISFLLSLICDSFVSAKLYMNVTVIMKLCSQLWLTVVEVACRCSWSERWRWWHHPSSSCQIQRTYQREISQQTILPVHLLPFSNNLSNKKKLTQLVVFPPKPFFVVIQVHLRQVLVRPIAPHPSVPTLPGQWKAR